jgi:peptidoglycan/xylan/chitin deacetylase (PgdA/CDA1 family)
VSIRGLGRLRKIVRRVQREIAPPAVVLMYHRVCGMDSDPWRLCVTPEHFAEQLQVLRQHCQVISLQKLMTALRKGRLPRRTVAITFDDGYADNLLTAKPLLEKYELPATIFVATGYVGNKREFWWDELDNLFLQPGSLPETLNLTVNGMVYKWELEDTANYTQAAYQGHRNWKPGYEAVPSPRQQVYSELWKLMQPLSESQRLIVRETLYAWAQKEPQVRPSYRTLIDEEVVALAAGGLIEIGAHTVTHPMLSTLPIASQREEIGQSKRDLEEILNREVPSFAYPYGRECDYTEETIALVKEAGFACAFTTSAGVIGQGAAAYRLPRLPAQDVSGEIFAKQLETWFCEGAPVF